MRAAPWLGRGEMFLTEILASNDPVDETMHEEPKPLTPHFVTRTEMLKQQIADRDKMITMLEKDVEFLRGLVKK